MRNVAFAEAAAHAAQQTGDGGGRGRWGGNMSTPFDADDDTLLAAGVCVFVCVREREYVDVV